ncbi:hypothetical protein AKJ16_DCAP18770 [Drosera capensis]
MQGSRMKKFASILRDVGSNIEPRSLDDKNPTTQYCNLSSCLVSGGRAFRTCILFHRFLSMTSADTNKTQTHL